MAPLSEQWGKSYQFGRDHSFVPDRYQYQDVDPQFLNLDAGRARAAQAQQQGILGDALQQQMQARALQGGPSVAASAQGTMGRDALMRAMMGGRAAGQRVNPAQAAMGAMGGISGAAQYRGTEQAGAQQAYVGAMLQQQAQLDKLTRMYMSQGMTADQAANAGKMELERMKGARAQTDSNFEHQREMQANQRAEQNRAARIGAAGTLGGIFATAVGGPMAGVAVKQGVTAGANAASQG